ncbi:MAG: hypothetical protein PVI46_08620, partial [Lysobacterales bacterium]
MPPTITHDALALPFSQQNIVLALMTHLSGKWLRTAARQPEFNPIGQEPLLLQGPVRQGADGVTDTISDVPGHPPWGGLVLAAY